MAKGYLISNRSISEGRFDDGLVKNPRYFVSKASAAKRESFANWVEVV